MTNVTLYDKNMNVIELRGVKWLGFNPEPVSAERFSEKVYNGDVVLGKSTNSRLINARFMYTAADFLDYELLRNEIYNLFNPLKDMWAVDEQMPGIKWRVDVEALQVERINGQVAECSVVFYSPVTYARSIGDSLDDFTYDSGLWSYGMGLQEDSSAQDYTHTTPEFQIYNPSDVRVDPREHELLVWLFYSGETVPGITINNETTGDVWEYTGSLGLGDIITLDGVKAKKDEVNIVGDANFGLLTLAEGMNDFTITGLNGDFEIQFKFPFLYV